MPKELPRRPVASLVPAARNARTHSAAQVQAIAASIVEFGFNNPVLIDDAGGIVAGHGRVLAAQALGLETVPVVVLGHLNETQRRAYLLADNRLGELAGWDDALLADELRQLAHLHVDLNALGFDAGVLAAALEPSPATLHGDPDAAPPLPATATTKEGDVWTLGRHRLICGDARRPDVLETLLAGAKAEVLLTDPPYCSGGFQEAGRAAGTWGDIAADNLSSRGYRALLGGVLEAARPQSVYVFTDWRMWCVLYELVEAAGVAVRSMIVWRKPSPGMGSLWRPQHELVLFGSRRPNHRLRGHAAIGNVLDAARSGNTHHYTEKPVALLTQILRNDAAAGRPDVPVVDPFAGSGSTLIACEELGRAAYGVEIEPKLCDVAVKRWETVTGATATRHAGRRRRRAG